RVFALPEALWFSFGQSIHEAVRSSHVRILADDGPHIVNAPNLRTVRAADDVTSIVALPRPKKTSRTDGRRAPLFGTVEADHTAPSIHTISVRGIEVVDRERRDDAGFIGDIAHARRGINAHNLSGGGDAVVHSVWVMARRVTRSMRRHQFAKLPVQPFQPSVHRGHRGISFVGTHDSAH